MRKLLPTFQNEDEEREFWATHDSTDYVDWAQAKPTVFPNLKPSTKTISLHMSKSMRNSLRMLANCRDVPHQSLIRCSSRRASMPSRATSWCRLTRFFRAQQ